jgi:hypothetical protein
VGIPPNTGGPAGNVPAGGFNYNSSNQLYASAVAVVYGSDAASWGGTPGAIREIRPVAGGLMGCGQGYVTAPSVTISGGAGATATATVSNYIAYVPVTSGGAGLSAPPTLTVTDTGSPTRTASLRALMTGAFAATMNGTTASGSPTVTGLSGTAGMAAGMSVSGTGIPAGTTIAAVASGTSLMLSANATASGTPSLSIADSFTYDAPALWLTAMQGNTPTLGTNNPALPLGGLQAASGASVANYAGQLEPDPAGIADFAAAPTMLAGANHGAVPCSPQRTDQTFKNKLHGMANLVVASGGGTLTSAADNTPVSWTSPATTVIGGTVYAPNYANYLDTMAAPSSYGQWTLVYDDPQVNTAGATAAWLTSNQVATPVSLSGPASPIVVPAGNVTIAGGVVTAVSLTAPTDLRPQLGAGWQGAAVVFYGGTGSGGAAATATVSGGVPTAVNVVAGGSYTAAPSAYLYGTRVAGSAVTQVFGVEYPATTTPGTGPSQWAAQVNLRVAQPQGQWNLGNPWVVAPDARTRLAAAAIDRTKPYAVDDAVVAALTTPSGRTIGPIRFMDATGNFGGGTNYVNPSDLKDGSRLFWNGWNTTTLNVVAARAVNTDPSNNTYACSSTKVYGPQAMYVQGPDSFGNCISLPATDAGTFTGGFTTWAAIELRFAAPHGLSSGQYVNIGGPAVGSATPVALTDAPNFAPAGNGAWIFVTGPNTIAFGIYVGGGTHSTRTQTLAATAEVPVNWTVTRSIPEGAWAAPYEYAAAMCAQLGCGYWLNIPFTATDACIQAIAQKVAANIGGTVPVYVEFDNELWNAKKYYFGSLYLLLGYLPANTPVLGGNTSNLPANTATGSASAALLTGHAHDVFAAAWQAAGMDPSRLKLIYASQFPGYGNVTVPMLDAAQRTGRRADYVCHAPYMDMPGDAPIVRAMAPAGSMIGGAQSLPADAINDLIRHWIASSQDNWYYWAQQGQLCQAFGQPLLPLATSSAAATAAATISGGAVTAAAVTGAGVGYLSAPTVTFSGGGGSGATATAAISGGAVIAAAVTAGGSGYTSAPTVAFSGGGGSGAAGKAVLTGNAVTGITITAGGSGYTSAPTIALTGGGGTGATATATVSGGSVTGITVTNGGSGYTSAPTVAIVGGGSQLPAATYCFYYTFVDGSGNETTVGLSQSSAFGYAGSGRLATMPPWPTWAQAMKLYVGPNTAPGVCTYYATVSRGLYNGTYPVGSAFPLNVAIPAGYTPPPATNQCAGVQGDAPVVPQIINYEGSVQTPIPAAVPLRNLLTHDSFSHPSYRDLIRGYYVMCQQGSPLVPGSGAVLSEYFELYYQPYTGGATTWLLADGAQQLPGDGLGHAYAGGQTIAVPPNRYATIQGGYPADGHDHQQYNVSPGFQASRDWWDATSPAPTRPPVAAAARPRRWYAGLTKPSARLGR